MNAAVALLDDATVTGVTVRLVDGRAKVFGQPAPALLEQLREHKALIIAILRGDHCRVCGRPIAWPRLGAGLTYADGTSECMACADSPTPANRTPGPGALAAGAPETLTPTQEGADPGPAWTDLDGWCRRIGALTTVAERRVVLREWVAAAGGWSDAAAIHLPVALPKGLALARLKAHARALRMQILEDEDDPALMAWLRGAK